MIVCDAPWDDANFGMKAEEVTVLDSDEDSSVLREIDLLSSGENRYCLIKFPQKRIALAHSLEKRRFRFLEAQFDLHKNLVREEGLASYLRKVADMGVAERITDTDGLNLLLEKIEGVFDGDRVCLDPFLGEEISLVRYRNWIRNNFDRKDHHLAWIRVGESHVGFFFLKEIDENSSDSALAGLFPVFKKLGYGPLVISAHLEYARSIGKKRSVTRVSLNNIESLRMHLAFGYEIIQSNYVMRYMSRDV